MKNYRALYGLTEFVSPWCDSATILGSGEAEFLRMCNQRKCTIVSKDAEGWLVEMWSVDGTNETLEAEEMVQQQDDVLKRVLSWLNG